MKRLRSMRAAAMSIHHDAADGFAPMHQLEAFIDALERQAVRDQVIDVDLLLHVPVHDPRHVAPSPGTPEGRSLPDSARDQLERTRADLRTRGRNADDDALAPATVAALERLTHDLH